MHSTQSFNRVRILGKFYTQSRQSLPHKRRFPHERRSLMNADHAIFSIRFIPLKRCRNKHTMMKKHAIERQMIVAVHINGMACFPTAPSDASLCLPPVFRRMVARFSNSSTPHNIKSNTEARQGHYGVFRAVTTFTPSNRPCCLRHPPSEFQKIAIAIRP